METKQKFIKFLDRFRKRELYSRLPKLIYISLFCILCMILLIQKWFEKEIGMALLLSFSEIIFLVVFFMLFLEAKFYFLVKNSRIYSCLGTPDLIDEIVITPFMIVFKFKKNENETLCINDSPAKTEFIKYLSKLFVEKQIVNKIN